MHYDFDSDDFCKRFLSECLRQNLDLAQRTLKLLKIQILSQEGLVNIF